MARIAGLTAERTSTGRATIIRLDVRKHLENIHLQNFLKDVGFEVETYELKDSAKASIKDADNYKKRKRFSTVESFMADLNS